MRARDRIAAGVIATDALRRRPTPQRLVLVGDGLACRVERGQVGVATGSGRSVVNDDELLWSITGWSHRCIDPGLWLGAGRDNLAVDQAHLAPAAGERRLGLVVKPGQVHKLVSEIYRAAINPDPAAHMAPVMKMIP